MALLTLITRFTDGLPLVQTSDPIPGLQQGQSQEFHAQARSIAKNLDVRSSTRMAVDAGSHIFSYMVEDGLVYIVMTERAYPTRLAIQYLETLHQNFMEELQHEHGDGWRGAIARIDKPYTFLRFERTIGRIRKEFMDSTSASNTARLKDELNEVQNIMKKSIAEVLGRGERLESVSRTSAALRSESDKFYKGAKKANLLDKYRTYATYVMVISVVLALLYWRFFL